MMQSIRTRYLAVTNTRPNRIKAQAAPRSIIIPWGDHDDSDANHAAAAKALADDMGWLGFWVGGCFNYDNSAREWVNIGKAPPVGYEPAGAHGRHVEGKDWFRVI